MARLYDQDENYVRDSWFGLPCWNGLSVHQQQTLVIKGTLPFGYRPEGECQNGAEVAVECSDDDAPGPRFYCYVCAIDYVVKKNALAKSRERHPSHGS